MIPIKQQFLLAQIDLYHAVLSDYQRSQPEADPVKVEALQEELNQLRSKVSQTENLDELAALEDQSNKFLNARWVSALHEQVVRAALTTDAETETHRRHLAAIEKAYALNHVVRGLAKSLPSQSATGIEDVLEALKRIDITNPNPQSATGPAVDSRVRLTRDLWRAKVGAENLAIRDVGRLVRSDRFFKAMFDVDAFYLSLIHQHFTLAPRFNEGETPKQYYRRLFNEINHPRNHRFRKSIELGAEIVVRNILQGMATPAERQQAVLRRWTSQESINQETPLYLASRWCNVLVIEVLLSVLTPEQQRHAVLVLTPLGGSAICCAASYGSVAALEIMLGLFPTPEEKQQAVLTRDGLGRTSINCVSIGDSAPAVLSLLLNVFPTLKQKQQAVLTPDYGGLTPFHYAGKFGNADALQFLFKLFLPIKSRDLILAPNLKGFLIIVTLAVDVQNKAKQILQDLLILLTPEEITQHFVIPASSRIDRIKILQLIPDEVLRNSFKNNDCLAQTLLADLKFCIALLVRSANVTEAVLKKVSLSPAAKDALQYLRRRIDSAEPFSSHDFFIDDAAKKLPLPVLRTALKIAIAESDREYQWLQHRWPWSEPPQSNNAPLTVGNLLAQITCQLT